MQPIGSTSSLIILAASTSANSTSRNAVSFSSARTTKRFPSPRCASAIHIVRREDQFRIFDIVSSKRPQSFGTLSKSKSSAYLAPNADICPGS